MNYSNVDGAWKKKESKTPSQISVFWFPMCTKLSNARIHIHANCLDLPHVTTTIALYSWKIFDRTKAFIATSQRAHSIFSMPRTMHAAFFADKGSERQKRARETKRRSGKEREPTLLNSTHVRIYPFCGMSDNSTKSNYRAGPAWKAPKLAAVDGNPAVRCAARFQNLIMTCCTCASIRAPCRTYMIRAKGARIEM